MIFPDWNDVIILVPTAYVVFTKTNGRHWICRHLTFNLLINPNEVAKRLAAGRCFERWLVRKEIVRLSLKLPSFGAKAWWQSYCLDEAINKNNRDTHTTKRIVIVSQTLWNKAPHNSDYYNAHSSHTFYFVIYRHEIGHGTSQFPQSLEDLY